MKPQCVDPVCTYPIEPGWDFCPACGTDNRPPRERRPVPAHRHQWLGGQGRCVRCGEPADEPYRFNRRSRLLMSGGCLAAGFSSLLSLGFVRLGLMLPATQLGGWVNSWYFHEMHHRVRRRYSPSRYYTTLLGEDVSRWLVIAAILLLLIGGWMLLKIPAPESQGRRRRRWF